MTDNPTLHPLPEYGDLMTLTDWLEHVRTGLFIDYDGHGYFATKDGKSDIRVKPSTVYDHKTQAFREENIDRRFTHVIWFNR